MSSILNQLINPIDRSIRISKAFIGFRSTFVRSKYLGVAMNFANGTDPYQRDIKSSGSFSQMSAYELSKMSLSTNPIEASLGIAAINSTLSPDRYTELNAFDIAKKFGEGKVISLVGHFSFAEKLKEVAKEIFILELNPHEGDISAEFAEDVIPKSQVVVITASTLVNHTIDELLKFVKDAYVILAGPTAPLSEILFECGFDALCGVKMVEEDTVIRQLSEGVSFRNIVGWKRVSIFKDR